jgi:hypothetical protein
MQAPLVKTDFPVGYCWPSDPNQFASDLYSLSYANVPDNTQGVVYGPTAPTPSPTVKLFYSSTTHRLYEFQSGLGLWTAIYYPVPFPSLWAFTEATEDQIKKWDNPTGNSATAGAESYTGPFWEIDHNYDGKFVLGSNGTTFLVGATGGAATVDLTAGNVPKHRHEINVGPESGDSSYLPDSGTSENGTFKVNGAEQIRFYDLPSTEIGRTRENVNGSIATSGVDPVSIMPPYRSAWIIKRTAREFYTL